MDMTLLQGDETYRYQLLARLQGDCEAYFDYGNQNRKRLWGGTSNEHIEAMKALWDSFGDDAKPEWLSLERIQAYEQKFIAEDAGHDESTTHTPRPRQQ